MAFPDLTFLALSTTLLGVFYAQCSVSTIQLRALLVMSRLMGQRYSEVSRLFLLWEFGSKLMLEEGIRRWPVQQLLESQSQGLL